MRGLRFRELFGVIFGFILIFTVLLVERIGILYEDVPFDVKMLPDDQIVHMKDTKKGKDCLVIWDSSNENSQNTLKVYNQVLIDMRVPFDVRDVNEEADSLALALTGYKTVVIAMSDLDPIGKNILTLTDWVGRGGRLLFGVTPYRSDIFDYFCNKIGVISAEYTNAEVSEFVSEPDYMLGAQMTYPIVDSYESSIAVVLDEKCKVYAHTEEGNIPLVWSREYQNGKFVVCNFGYTEKAYRGIFSSAYSLLEDVFIYPVINASIFYLDDFPSPVPSGNAEYIKRDYNMGISDFYSRVWWPDMLALGKKHDIKYTGLIIENYKDQTSGELPSNETTSNYYYYGNMLLNQGGELGYHGYNHQPLCLENFEFQKELGYNTWEDMDVMRDSVKELIRFSSSIFPNQDMSVYVPPSDILSDEGRQMLGYEFPQIKTIASIYLEGADEYVQEYEVASDGIVETPRIVSGGILDDYMQLSAFSELNFHYISSHFMHPDDLLDEDRGAEIGWETQRQRIDEYMGWIDESAKEIRHVTGSGMAGAVQRYVNVVPDYTVGGNSVILTTNGIIDSAYYLVRVNDGNISNAYGGELIKLNDTLYLLKAQAQRVTMTRR